MSSPSLAFRSLAVAVLAALTLSCADSPTGPRTGTPVGAIRLSDTLFTRSAVVRAGIDVPAGYALRPGSVRWTVASGSATVSEIAGTSDSVSVSLTTTGAVTLRANYTLTSAGSASTISLAGPSLRVAGDVALETARSITVAAPRLEYGVLPTALVTAGTTLGGVRVDILDASGRLMINATDSIVVALDPTSGTAGATLLGTAAARAVGGQATFAGLSIQRAGSAYRLIASSPTITVRDTATTFVVAGAPSAATSTLTIADSIRAVGQTTTATVTLRDQYGNLVTTATSSAFAGTASIGTLGGFTCVSGVCTATYSATTVGSATIGATIGGTPIVSSPRPVQVTAGPAVRLVITGLAAQTAGSTQNITITAYDAFGNVATSYDGLRTLTFGGASVAPNGTTQPTITSSTFSASTGLTFVNGVATNVPMTLYKVENAVITATDGTLTTAGSDRLPVTVTAATPSPTTVGGGASGVNSSITVSRDTLEVGDSLTVTVRLFDTYGNPILNATPSTFVPAVSGGTLGSFTCVSGVCTARWAAPTTPGAQTIGATIGGAAIGGSPATVQVVTGPPDASTSTIAVQDSVTTQGSTTTVRITLRDRYGNPVTTGTPTNVGATTTLGTLGSFTCTNGVCSATYTGTSLGTATITGSIGGTPIPTTTSVRVTAGVAAKLVITGGGTQVAGTSQNITITAFDANGNVATGYTGTKTLTFSGAGLAPSGTAPTINSTTVGTAVSVTFVNGIATLVPMRLVKVETAVIAATDGTISAAGADRLSVVVTAATPDATQSALTLSRTTVAVTDTLTATVTLKDAFGNPVTTAAATDFANAATAGTLGAFTCTGNVCSARYTAGTTPGTPTITATIGGTAITGAPATVTVTAGPAARLVITGDSTQVAGATQNITITAFDAQGNVATGYTGAKNLTFSGASVSPNLDAPTVRAIALGGTTSVTFVNGVATLVPLRLFTAETAVLATTDGTIAAAGTDRLTVRVTADDASPVVTDLQASPASITADGVTTSVLTLQLKDAYGNATTNVASPGTVEIVQTAGTGTLVADFTNIGGGSYTQTVTSAAAAGSGTFKVRLNGTIGTPQAVVTYVAAGGPLSRLVCTLSQAAAQSAASNTTVALCGATAVGDLEIVTLALDGVDDVVAPTGVNDGTWVKISSTIQTTGSGGNKPMLLVLYARRYAAGNTRSVTFSAATNHKWSVDMVTFVSSGTGTPSGGDIIVSQNSTGSGLGTPGLTAAANNTVLYYVMGNSLTGNTATPTPDGLTLLANNNTGGTSSASFMELLVNAGDVAPARTWVNTKTANTVVVQLLVRP